MAADEWHPARLIPAVGIRSRDEQEKRATSSLLAVMRAVPEFGHALVTPLGAPKGRINTYAEVQLKDSAGKTHIPDGAIVKNDVALPRGSQDQRGAASSGAGRPLLGQGP